jgi:hypothetical protein
MGFTKLSNYQVIRQRRTFPEILGAWGRGGWEGELGN